MGCINTNPFIKYHKTRLTNELTEKLGASTISLFDGLQNIGPLDLNISDYNKRYLEEELKDLESVLAQAAYIVGSTLSESRKSLKDIVFIEYGGGTGVLSPLAKRLGVGTVIYNDIYDVSCRDAEEIAKILGCPADYYVEGGIDDLVKFCDRHQIRSDAIASHDVLEHIYDIDDFCRKLHLISHEGTTMVHSTGANMFFYPCVKSVIRKQIEAETKDREEQRGHKKRDCLSAYATERMKIIKEYAPNLNENESKELVINTRGLMRDEILKSVDRYIESGEFPKLIEHATNTCDPYTGNWEEHLINPYYLQETLSFNGFHAKVLPGYHGKRGNFVATTISSIVNLVIRMSCTYVGLHFSPYYSIYAKYHGKLFDEIHKQHMYKRQHSPLWYFVLLSWGVLSRLRHQQFSEELTEISWVPKL